MVRCDRPVMSERCEIVAVGADGPLVRSAFDGFEITTLAGGRIRLVGSVIDQAALHGVLHRLQDLGLQILDVHLVPHA